MESWLSLGKNPYGADVQECAGRRRCSGEGGWRDESLVDPIEVCRALTPEAAALAINSMAIPSISSSFGHHPARAYAVWSTPSGASTPVNPSQWVVESRRPGWTAFSKGVSRAWGNAANRAWAARRMGSKGVPRWTHTLTSPSATALRGIQWGLARRLEAISHRHPDIQWMEWGLVESEDAATRRLPVSSRTLRAASAGSDSTAPSFLGIHPFPLPPGTTSGGHFGENKEARVHFNEISVIWCTSSSLKAWGRKGWSSWWKSFSIASHSGWIVLDAMEKEWVKELMAALKARKDWRVWRIFEQEKEIASIWHIGDENGSRCIERCSLEDWAGMPECLEPERFPEDAGDGRVTVRSLSRIGPSEGCAPLRLEAAQFQALQELSRQVDDVDAWIADGLGVSVAVLGTLLSPEQVDAVALARQSLEAKSGFLVADAAGFGKGRVLAALAIIGLRQKRAVCFFTENAPLFSDFFRDIAAVSPSWLPHPHLLHQDAVVRLPDGTVWAKSLKSQAFKQWLSQENWLPSDDRFLMTTYAQLARSSGSERQSWLRHRLGKEGWVLLDESHNAAGDSLASEKVAAVFQGLGVVFASATFAKNESNLGIYRPALPMGSGTLKLVHRALAGESGIIREVLTESMARAGKLIRREHSPIAPPSPVWVGMTDEKREMLHAFEEMWRRIFEVAEDWEKSQGGASQFAWLKLGAVLSRSVREFSLLIKAQTLVDVILTALKDDKKVVVAVDSTFEAALRELEADMPPDDIPDDDETMVSSIAPRARRRWKSPPLWKHRWMLLLNSVAKEGYWTEGNASTSRQREANWRAAAAAIDSLPNWDISPLDALQRHLESMNVKVGELSGRTIRLSPSTNNEWEVIPRQAVDRVSMVNAFNSGLLDVIIITRAGSTGISLHAGEKFSDQRVRCLIEWDIATNPIHRVQFWGRVRRKDQVVEPEFKGLLLDTPADRRVMEREMSKHARLSAHMGGRIKEDLGWVSPEGDAIVNEWCLQNPKLARRLGVALPVPGQPCARVDRALIRSTVLPATARECFVERLSRGIALVEDWAVRSRHDPMDDTSREVRRAWWWGDSETPVGESGRSAGIARVDVVERVWMPSSPVTVSPLSFEMGVSGKTVFDQWWSVLRSATLSGEKPSDYQRAVWDWVKKVLPGMIPGTGIYMTSPETGRGVLGMILGVEAPPSSHPDLWAPTQVAVNVWLVGDEAPQKVPLSVCAYDPLFRLSGKAAKKDWFSFPSAPRVALTMEGNPILAASWGQRWNVGRSALIRDAERGEQSVWLLPGTFRWSDLWSLPRDLVSVDHAVEFLKYHSDGELLGALPKEDFLVLSAVSGGLLMRLSSSTYVKAKKSWLGFSTERILGRVKMSQSEFHYRVPLSRVRRLLHALDNQGIGWRVATKHLPWYKKSSQDYCRLLDGSSRSKKT